MKVIIRFCLLVSLISGGATLCHAGDALDVWYFRSTNALNTVRFVGGIFVGVGNQGRIATSPDGTTWSFQSLSPSTSLRGVTFGTVAGTGLFAVVGDDGAVWTSPTAASWVISGGAFDPLSDIAWDPVSRLFVATVDHFPNNLAAPRIYYSASLSWWDAVDLPASGHYLESTEMKRVACFQGVFFAAGAGGFTDNIWRSTNGWDWEYLLYTDGYSGNFVQGNGKLAFVHNEACGPLISSDGGTTWVSVLDTNVCPRGCPFCYMGLDVCFGNGTFATVGYNLQGGLSAVKGPLTSTNLTQWQVRTPLQGKNLVSIAYGKGTFVAAGPDGIYQSQPVATPWLSIKRMQDTNAVLIRTSGEIGRGYRLQTSTNSSGWDDLLNFTNTLPTMEFTCPLDADANLKLFRVLSP